MATETAHPDVLEVLGGPDDDQQRWRRSRLGVGYGTLLGHDPRTSSAQSLVPSEHGRETAELRKLLLVYIHGFMGSDASFQSFPAHVHHYLKLALADSHVVHTKIYPKYKTYKAIEVARDNFSKWLEPLESPNTDVVLLGHSMGGLLAADVVLIPTWNERGSRFFQHRILGIVHLDAPLLGLHPGIIVSGISSLFRPKTETDKTPEDIPPSAPGAPVGNQSNASSLTRATTGHWDDVAHTSPPQLPPRILSTDQAAVPPPLPPRVPSLVSSDPNYNPTYPNDVRLKERPWWKNVVHFVKKHNSEGLVDAATKHVMSHLEFGSCLLDFHCLKIRYENLRKLEDVDEIKYRGFPHVPPQVRFVQYYTVCHGFPKKPKTPKVEPTPDVQAASATLAAPGNSEAPDGMLTVDDSRSSTSTPRISVSDHSDREEILRAIDSAAHEKTHDGREYDQVSELSDDEDSELDMLDPLPISDDERVAELQKASFSTPKAPDLAAPAPIPVEGASMAAAVAPGISHTKSITRKPLPSSTGVDTVSPTSAATENKAEVATLTPEDAGSNRAGRFIEDFSSEVGVDISSGIPSRTETVSSTAATSVNTTSATEDLAVLNAELPPVPSLPEAPLWPDLDKYTDKDARKQAEKEARRVQKSYEQAVKNRDRAIRERNKIIEKRRRKRAQEVERLEKEEAKQQQKEQALKTAATQVIFDEQKAIADAAAAAAVPHAPAGAIDLPSPMSPLPPNSSGVDSEFLPIRTLDAEAAPTAAAKEEKPAKPKKDRKFCTLPSKVNGVIDPKWVKIFMEDMDEVTAHSALFFPGPHYEKLVGDVGDLVTGWVHEDATKRMVLLMDEEEY